MDNSVKEQSSKITLNDYLNVFVKNKKKIFIITFIGVLLSVLFAFFILKPQFLSSGTVKTATNKSSMLGGILSSTGLSDLGDFGDMAAGGGSSAQDLALYENIILSRGLIEKVILKFNIMEQENFKYMYDAVKNFRENFLVISKDKTAGTFSVGVYDEDPVRAKEMTDFLIDELNKKNIELNVQNAKNNRQFIQERFDLVNVDLKKSEDSLQQFQDIYGIAPDLQVQFAARGSMELEAEIRSEEVKLELLRKILTNGQPELDVQEEKILALKRQLDEIINSEYTENKMNLKGSPGIILNYIRLKRNVEIQNKILVTLIPMLEQAKIEENRETPTILILDAPNVPDKKAKPKRLNIVFAVTFLCFFTSYLYFYLRNFFAGKSIPIEST